MIVGLQDELAVAERPLLGGRVTQGVRVFEQLARQNRQVARGRNIGRLARARRQTVNGMVVGGLHAELDGAAVHQLNESILGTGHMRRQRHGGVIRRLDHQRVVELVHREHLLLGQVHLGAAGP